MDGVTQLLIGSAIGGVGGVLMGVLAYTLVRRRYVTVSPSEYAIHTGRGGKVLHKGLGQSFFCGPFDSYMIFPSTIQRVQFEATQITEENQGVRVQGMEQLVAALPGIVSEMRPEHWTTISGDVPYGALESVVARVLAAAQALGLAFPRSTGEVETLEQTPD